MNFPLYRGKVEGTDEYIIGFLEFIENDGRSVDTVNSGAWISNTTTNSDGFKTRIEKKVDPDTIAIGFPWMRDSNGEQLFASLSDNNDGLGGDILFNESELESYVLEFTESGIVLFEYLDNGKIRNFVKNFTSSFFYAHDNIHHHGIKN